MPVVNIQMFEGQDSDESKQKIAKDVAVQLLNIPELIQYVYVIFNDVELKNWADEVYSETLRKTVSFLQ